MQAAVVSVLLMAGACGNSGEPLPAPSPAIDAPNQPSHPAPQSPVACDPSGKANSTYPSPAGGIYYRAGLFGCPHYTPVWLLKDCAAYYPGNYARPYDYREIFNYPWNGPRPSASAPPVEMDAAARTTKRR